MTPKEVIQAYTERGILLTKVWHNGEERIHFYDDSGLVHGKVAKTLVENKESLLPYLPEVCLLSQSDKEELMELAKTMEEEWDRQDYERGDSQMDALMQEVWLAAQLGELPRWHPPLSNEDCFQPSPGSTVRDVNAFFQKQVETAYQLRAKYGDRWVLTNSMSEDGAAVCRNMIAVAEYWANVRLSRWEARQKAEVYRER